MKVASPEFWIEAIVVGILLGSLSTWICIARRWRVSGTVLAYEPRRPVPWNALVALPAVLLAVLQVCATLARDDLPRELTLSEFAGGIATVVGIGVIVVVLAIIGSKATWRDLGLPTTWRQFRIDIGIGILGWLACLPVVSIIQASLAFLFQQNSQNPVLKLVEENPDWRHYAIALVSAVIVAPLTEEIYYRLLLQGWLEKREDNCVNGDEGSVVLEFAVPNEEPTSVLEVIETTSVDTKPPSRGIISGLRHGTFPILTSSLFFALAHFGNGPDPVAIFVLAIFLGYIYQRTHRILPCIVMHAAFNALSLLYSWLVFQVMRPELQPGTILP